VGEARDVATKAEGPIAIVETAGLGQPEGLSEEDEQHWMTVWVEAWGVVDTAVPISMHQGLGVEVDDL
jgi:hypothetical protein